MLDAAQHLAELNVGGLLALTDGPRVPAIGGGAV